MAKRRPATLALLLERGANADAADDRGRTALLHAAQGGDVASVDALLQGGADAGKRDADGWHALGVACARGRVDCARALLAAAPDVVDAPAGGGAFALHWAARANAADLVRDLLKKRPDGPDERGATALARARAVGFASNFAKVSPRCPADGGAVVEGGSRPRRGVPRGHSEGTGGGAVVEGGPRRGCGVPRGYSEGRRPVVRPAMERRHRVTFGFPRRRGPRTRAPTTRSPLC